MKMHNVQSREPPKFDFDDSFKYIISIKKLEMWRPETT